MTAATRSDAALSSPRGPGARLASFIGHDLIRQLKMVESVFFIAVLPTALFLMFGALAEWGDAQVGNGNMVAHTMLSMALYGAVTATTAIAGSAAVERQLGWGRQLSLTALSGTAYMLGKAMVAVCVAVLPVALIYAVGAATGAELDGAWRWAASAGLTLLAAVPFAFYGLAAALLFRSEAAVGAASGMLVVFSFLGNLFMPLNGLLLDIGRFTPLYGPGVLARWPMMEGKVVATDGSVTTDPLWAAVLSVTVWTLVFLGICLLANRRRTSR
ncbi:ABC transporter permease [Micrococcus lylae]|uniref:ABC transporter permease n=1 Tax=Micrococcus lylae TaxID=1273 RepID=UPI0021A83857|nr:ABC transporter permease [Micrococcus lylae]MCT2006729.1 ABC transporter permease [Micrococcus lylae]MCT2070611.1 ABC transporter permease [Micrococcus lylae]